MIRVFLKDMVDSKILKKTIIINIAIYILIKYVFIRDIVTYLGINFAKCNGFILFSLSMSVYFFVETYLKNDRVIFYYSIPYKVGRINFSMLLAFMLDTLIRKILVIFVLFISMKFPFRFYIILVSYLPMMVMLCMMLHLEKIGKVIKVLITCSYIVIILLFNSYISTSYTIYFITLLFFIMINVWLVYLLFIRNDSILSNNSRPILTQWNCSNYFIRFLFSETSYILNLVGILVMIFIVSIYKKNIISISLSFAIGTINTPILTIFSSESELFDFDRMIPNKYKSLSKSYIQFLLIYFCIVNSIILILSKFYRDFYNILMVFGISIIEVIIAFCLEKYYPIKNKKTVVDIWRNPRKYILPLCIFILVTIYVIGK